MDEWNKNRALQPDHGKLERGAKDAEAKEKRKESLDRALDRGLEDSFPGSDPVAVTQPPASKRDKHGS